MKQVCQDHLSPENWEKIVPTLESIEFHCIKKVRVITAVCVQKSK